MNQRLTLFVMLLACVIAGFADFRVSSAVQNASEASKPSRKADADVIAIRVEEKEGNLWDFHVTVRHPDTGWDDYADGWDVVLPDGTVVKPAGEDFTRLLAHPHVEEQPFTRSQFNIAIPPEVTHVTVRAHDMVDGWGGKEVVVDLYNRPWLELLQTKIPELGTAATPWYWYGLLTVVTLLVLTLIVLRRRKRTVHGVSDSNEPEEQSSPEVDATE